MKHWCCYKFTKQSHINSLILCLPVFLKHLLNLKNLIWRNKNQELWILNFFFSSLFFPFNYSMIPQTSALSWVQVAAAVGQNSVLTYNKSYTQNKNNPRITEWRELEFSGILSKTTIQRIWFIMFKGILYVAVGIWISSAIANSHWGETKWEFHTLVCNSILPFLPMLGAVQWRVKHMHVWTITKRTSEVTNPCLLPPSASPNLSSLSPGAVKKQVWTGRCLLSISLGSFPVQTLLCPHQSRFPAVLARV